MLRAVGLLALLVALGAGALSWRDARARSRMDERLGAQRELAVAVLAPRGTAPRAGVSARAPIRVQPLPDRLARQLGGSADFHRLSHRCGVCHTTPDPALHAAAEWRTVVERMAGTMEAAGLLPLGDADRAAILRVLGEHAAQ